MNTIPEMLEVSADRFRQRVAIEDGDVSLTYPELLKQARVAAGAYRKLGVEHRDRVAIWGPNTWEWIVAALGAHFAGATLVPINTRFVGREAQDILDRSRAKVLVTVQGFLGKNYVDLLERPPTTIVYRGPVPETAICFEDFLASASPLAHAVAPDDLSDILFTSGTTGRARGVMTTHAQNLAVYGAWTEVVGLVEGDRYLIVNPFFHAFGYKAGWLSALMRGATILPHAVFDPTSVLARIERDRVSVLPGPPTLYQSMLAADYGSIDRSSLRLAVTGAAVIPVDLVRRMKHDLGFRTVITGYGLTETCGVVTMCRFDDDLETIATTSGRGMPGVELRVVDSDGHDVDAGQPGEIIVRGFNVMAGYLDDIDATRDVIDSEGWLHTQDIGVRNERGYVQITDRTKDMFISGGFNCYPAEIERRLLERSDIVHAAVIGIPDERLGEVGMAFIVAKAPIELSLLEAWCKANMANYKVPRRFAFVDALPMNAAGKVQKFVLRESAQDLRVSG